ncbi:N-acetylglucosamine-6-phosphate deacetylase [Planctobacterium marinum]|uniref:N-acetylgalactosamine-6-phosphate deacetylase n=1 Tax=Planctobacterium marinum TaxID=1631968 RepID=A0AA48HMQ0_9ALTE|nr:N-acetylgalactosamine-6-phosphate deacetylase [Planctobacterium marinum]
MATQCFTVDKILTSEGWQLFQKVTVENGTIADISAASKVAKQHYSGTLIPGFVDLQVNGGGGKLLNLEPELATVKAIVDAHRQFGTTAMLPTLITDNIDTMQRSADAVTEAIVEGVDEVIGIHFEGPLLQKDKKGVHPEQFIRPVSDAELTLYCRQDLGEVLVTLAPDNVSPDVIKDLVEQGVHVCLGHSNASFEQVCTALEAGATGFTHIYNAMSPLTSREPGMVGAALADKASYAGLVLDHHHVHPAMSKLAIETKGIDKVFLVTDAMAHVGCAQQSLPYFDTLIQRDGDKLTTPDGTLAGSCLDMRQAVLNAHRDLALPLEQAIAMASHTPASYLGMTDRLGELAVGKRADYILLDSTLNIDTVFVAGVQKTNKAGINHDQQ